MGAGPLQNRPAQGGVGPGVGNDLRRHPLDDAVFVAAQGEFHLHGVALGMDQKALCPGKLHFHRALCEIGDQGGVMLDGHVLLAAKAAAHQAVADLHQFRPQAQHPHDLVLGVVGPLVCREDQYPLPLRIGHGALRFQEGMLRPRGVEPPGEDVLGFGNRHGGVAPLDVLVGKEVPGPVHQGCAGKHGLPGAADHRQFLIVHPHQFLGPGQDLLALGSHQADGVPQIVGDIPHGNHGVPVLHQVAHLVFAGDVGGSVDPHHPRQGQGLFCMDGQHPGPGVLGADGAGVNHTLYVHVVRIGACACDLLLYIHPGHPGSQGPVLGGLRHLSGAEDLRCQQDAVDNLHIAGAAADIVPDGKGGLLPGRGGVLIQQPLGGHHHPRDAEAALDGPGHAEGVGIGLLLEIRQALHGDDSLPLQFIGLGDAGLGGLPVDEDGAGTAGALAASVFHRGQAQFVPQIAKEFLILLHSHTTAVHGKYYHRNLPLPRRAVLQKRLTFPCLLCTLYNSTAKSAITLWSFRYFIFCITAAVPTPPPKPPAGRKPLPPALKYGC